MNKYFNQLKIDIPLLKIKIPGLEAITANMNFFYTQKFDVESSINGDLLDFFANNGIYFDYCELFYSIPNFTGPIHRDLCPGEYSNLNMYPRDMIKINWIFGGHGSTMNWYSTKSNVSKQVSKTTHNSVYMYYKPSEVNLECSADIGSLSLVQSGLPHTSQTAAQYRYCISLFPYTVEYNTKRRLTMEQAYARLNKYSI
jgi:hypothetical protein